MKAILVSTAVALFGFGEPAAADAVAQKPAKSAQKPAKSANARPAAPSVYDWSGTYVGFHFGYGGGSFGPATIPLPAQGELLRHSVTGIIGGYQAGINVQYASGLVLGLEGDMTFIAPHDDPSITLTPYHTTYNYFATARARAGYAFGPVLPYVTGGVAFAQPRVITNDEAGDPFTSKTLLHFGWAAGIGVEYAMTGNWTGKVEYNYVSFGSRVYELGTLVPRSANVEPELHLIKVGLNYRLWPSAPSSELATKAPRSSAFAESDDWSIHGQSTWVPQTYVNFRSPYQAAFSLPGHSDFRTTWTANAFIGRRLWEGGEVYFNPELDQGFAVGPTVGLAGFANGEAQKGGATFPKFRAMRYFFRQTFGLGGEQETVEDGPNQVAGKRDIDRVTVTVGRFAVGDYFDNNAYAHDPRADFLNWALWSSAAWDFPANLPGFTRGAVVELNRKDWALRAGYFQVPSGPNRDVLTFNSGGSVVEWEGRYAIAGQPGKVRVGAFLNRGNMANYRTVLAIVDADPTLDINQVADDNHMQRWKYGFYANLEQALSKDVGMFARVSWNDGNNDILSFTDIDRSVSGGVSIMGASWGRPNDKIGIGGAVNGLSAPHRDFLAAGGYGLLIGDGALNYRPETIFETFYALNVNKWSTLTLDYQFIANPAYNADRGPVSLFAARIHAEF